MAEGNPLLLTRRSTIRRALEAIDNHPIPTLLLATAIITFLFWNKVDNAVNALYQATARVDNLVKDVVEARADIRQIKSDTSKIDELQRTVSRVDSTASALNTQFKNIKPFEVRVIESYGLDVNETLLVDTVAGVITAFPLDQARAREVEQKNFVKTGTSIRTPRQAVGYAPPQPAIYSSSRTSLPTPAVRPQ
jgi:hypothetical protein